MASTQSVKRTPRKKRYQGSPEWLAERKGGIGSSDVPTLINGDEAAWRDLFAIKLGILPDTVATETMSWGLRLEDPIADAYSERTGHKVQRVDRILRHRELDFVRASLDRRRAGAVVELKKWGFPSDAFGPDGSDQVPDSFIYQVQQQMAVTGLPVADIAVLFAGREMRVYTVGRDDGTIQKMLTLEERAWAYVARGEAPPWPGPAPVRHLLTEGEVEASPEIIELIPTLLEAQRVAEDWAIRADALKNLIRDELADAAGARGPDFHITYKPNKDRVTVAWDLVASAYRKAAIEQGADPEQLAAIESLFTTSAPGARPLRITIEKGALVPA